MKKVITIFIVVLFAGLTSCQRDRVSGDAVVNQRITSMNQIVVPQGFDFETSQEYKFIFALGEMTPFQGKYLVQWYTNFPHAKAKARHSAFMDLNNPFVSDVTLPSNTQRVFVKLTSPSGSSFVQEMVVNNTTSHTFYTGKNAGKAASYTCPTCLSGCDVTMTYNGNEKFDDDNTTYCVTGATKTDKDWSLEKNGVVVRVCVAGSVTIDKLDLKESCTLIITSGTTFNVNDALKLDHVDAEIIVCDGATFNYDKSTNTDLKGTITNYGTATLDVGSEKMYLKEDATLITNHGTMTITTTRNYDGLQLLKASQIVNNGTMNLEASMYISNDAKFTNNCKVIQTTPSSYPSYIYGTLKNFGYYEATNAGIDLEDGSGGSRKIVLGNNAYLKTTNLIMGNGNSKSDGWINGPSSGNTAFLHITNSVSGNGGYLNRHFVVCAPNGSTDFNNANVFSNVGFNCSTSSTGGVYIPSSACNVGYGVPQIQDADGDGVADNVDEYPNDITRAYNVYSPSQGNYKTFAVEDLFPYKGDFDFNDLVVDYNIQSVTNADNKIVEQIVTVVTKAMGGSKDKGFGFNLSNLVPGDVSSVTGASNYPQLGEGDMDVTLNSNGTEDGQSSAVIIAYNNVKDHWADAAVGSFQNVRSADAYQDPDTSVLTITYATPYDGTINVEPFAFVDTRSKEIHTKNTEPTDLMDDSFFGTADDDSNGSSTFYTTANGLPWAIVIEDGMETVEEKNDITTAYLKFASWASSGGSSFGDWHTNNGGDYRDGTKLYTK